MNWMHDENELVVFFEISDEQLIKIQNDVNYFSDREFLEKALRSSGNNAHIFGFYHKTGYPKEGSIIIKKMLDSLDKYNTISWWDRDSNKFYIKRRE